MSLSTSELPAPHSRIWPVGALCRAIADALESRFNPVEVRGEISGFSRVASGHCYFVLKDETGQLKCAMFRRATGLLDFVPKDGESVVVRARLGVYEPRGDLQLVVESMSRAGQGALFEQFLRLKAKLEAEGLFDPARKRPIPAFPRGIGLVTSLGAAALHDVVTLLRRRAPHLPVLIAPASVQGAGAAAELSRALAQLNAVNREDGVQATGSGRPHLDVILLVRGGGSMEDLWPFNDEALARAIVASRLPVVSGVGHETDFSIADFVADLRAPTPTAAAELAAQPLQSLRDELNRATQILVQRVRLQADRVSQQLDQLTSRWARPSELLMRQRMSLLEQAGRLREAAGRQGQAQGQRLDRLQTGLNAILNGALRGTRERFEHARLRLELSHPRHVLSRGFVWVQDGSGRPVTHVSGLQKGDALGLQFVDGQARVDVQEIQLK